MDFTKTPIGAPIHRSLVQPILIAGMAWKPAVLVFLAAVALIASGLHWYTITLAGLEVVLGGLAVRKLTAWDPQFEQVLQRYVTYRRAYAAEALAGVRRPSLGRRALPSPTRPAVPNIKEIG